MDVIANESSSFLKQASGNTGSCDRDILAVHGMLKSGSIQA
jgi:hypothetical protein